MGSSTSCDERELREVACLLVRDGVDVMENLNAGQVARALRRSKAGKQLERVDSETVSAALNYLGIATSEGEDVKDIFVEFYTVKVDAVFFTRKVRKWMDEDPSQLLTLACDTMMDNPSHDITILKESTELLMSSKKAMDRIEESLYDPSQSLPQQRVAQEEIGNLMTRLVDMMGVISDFIRGPIDTA